MSRQTSRMSHATPNTRVAVPRASDPPAEALVGTELGNYRLLELIGEGGMGRVYLAEHRTLGRRVAIKLLRPSLSSNRSAVARFFHEAKIVNRIRHHNIVDITDFVELSDGAAFIVMELLEGRSLRDVLRGDDAVSLAEALAILDQVCAGLDAIHGIGVVHRDLKPGNIFVCDDRAGSGWVKLLDFGVAKLADVELPDARDGGMSAPQTAEGAVLGTPAYMSPEQAAGEELDARSDIYAIGTILYELVCGAPPFREKRFVDYVHAHAAQTPRAPSQTESGRHAPAALEQVILRCLEKRPERRYQDVTTLRAALADVRAALATGAIGARPRRRRGWLAAAVAAVLAGGGAVAFAVATGGPASSSAAPPPAAATPAPVVEPARPPADAGAVAPADAAMTAAAQPDAAPAAPPPARTRRGARRSRRPSPPPAAPPPAPVTADPSPPAPRPAVDDGKEVHPAATINPFDESP